MEKKTNYPPPYGNLILSYITTFATSWAWKKKMAVVKYEIVAHQNTYFHTPTFLQKSNPELSCSRIASERLTVVKYIGTTGQST